MRKLMKGNAGMTLIEILIVITIIGVVMTLVGSRVYKQFARARIKTTQLAIQQLVQAVTEYQMDYNKIPSGSDGLVVLEGDYTESVPNDSWGNQLHYEVPGPDNRPFDIISDGPDGVPGTEDDISYSAMKKK